MTSRTKRVTKAINYSTIENGSYSDDDFTDFTPPSKKKREKSNRPERNKENKANKAKENIQDILTGANTSKNESPKNRLPLAERKFQRDLQLAMEISSEPKCIGKDFQGFQCDEKIEECESSLEPSHSVSVTTVAEEVESKPKPNEDRSNNVQERLRPSVEDEQMPGTSDGLTLKRPRKKVNFVEDDSDDWSDDSKSEIDSDSSEFSPSPCKKNSSKSQNKTKIVRKPVKAKLETSTASRIQASKQKNINSTTETPSIQTPASENNTSNIRKPIITTTNKNNNSIDTKPIPTIPSPLNNNPAITKPNIPTTNNKNNNFSAKPITPVNAKPSKSVTSPCILNSPSTGLVRKFKSPTVGNVSESNSSRSPSSHTGIGLRLGLSRRVSAKPLHPNASVK